MRRTLKRFAAPLVIVLALTLALPAVALATPREDRCAAYGSLTYAMSIPDSMRTLGTHHIDWHSSFLDENGVLQVFDTQSQIEVVEGAPSYDGQVLIRLFSNWASLPNGDVDFDIQAINPTQRASFYLVSTFFRGTPNAETDALSIRWETSPGVWSAWVSPPRSALRSFCQENFQSLFTKEHGWAL
jgi:hypothetical protein